jgi:Raf kinase inhibitor-like YbhB/YbcL family protein
MFSQPVEEIFWDEKKGIPIADDKHHFLREKRNLLYANVGKYKFLKLDSEAFLKNGMIPHKYTCDGVNINPPISIEQIPVDAKSLAVIVDDPDAPGGNFCHWVSWNIPITDEIMEGEHRGLPGKNDFGYFKYNGPCPPAGTHRYYFKVYALDCALDIPSTSGRAELEKAMRNHVVGFGFLVGKYHTRM